jgi:DNA-damage-inducible protein J
MAANALVTTRINESIKNEAASVLEEMGLTISDGMRLFLMKVAKEKTLPFDIWKPSGETLQAIEDMKAGNLETVTIEQLRQEIKDLTR